MRARGPRTSNFAERIFQLLKRVEYRRAGTLAELDAIARLRYEAFCRDGAQRLAACGRLQDAFDRGANVYNVAVYLDGELAAAARLHYLENRHQTSPALALFGEFLVPELSSGKPVLDANTLVASATAARRHPELPYLALRINWLAGQYFGTERMAVTVPVEHQAFYRKRMLAYEVCGPRLSPWLKKPVALLFVELSRHQRRLLQQHPYWQSSPAERQALFADGSNNPTQPIGE